MNVKRALSKFCTRWVPAPGLLLLFLLAVVPLVLGVGYALLYSVGLTGALSEGFTTIHWRRVFANPEVYYSFGFSIYVAAVALCISVVAALTGALLLKEKISVGRFSYVVYLPLAIPGIVAALYIMQLLGGAGLVSRLAFHFGIIESIRSFPGLINDAWGIGIIACLSMLATPFFMIYFRTIYQSERLDALTELSRTLGARPWHIIRKIAVPIMLRRAYPTLVLYYIFMLGPYEIPLLLGRQSPQMVSVLTIRKLRRFNLLDIPQAYVIALLYITIILIAIGHLFKKRKLSYDL